MSVERYHARGRELTVRAASTLNDLDAVWTWFESSGFLYPDKLDRMGPSGTASAKKVHAGLLEDTQRFSVLMVESEGRLVATCSVGRYSPEQSWIMHLAGSGDRLAAMFAIVSACNRVIRSSCDWVAYTFRDGNVSVRKLLRDVPGIERLPVEQERYSYFTFPGGSPSPDAPHLHEGVSVAAATDADLAECVGRVSERRRAAAQAVRCTAWRSAAPGRGSFDDTRERATLVVRTSAGAALVVLDVAPPWWNLSNLSTGAQLFLSDPSDDRLSAVAIDVAADWFRRRAVAWTMLVPDGDRGVNRVLARRGHVPHTTYCRIGFRRDLFVAFTVRYAQLLCRGYPLPFIEGATCLT